MVAYAPSELYPTRKYGFQLSTAMRSATWKRSGVSCCGRQSVTRGTRRMCPYSIGDTLMRTTCGESAAATEGMNSAAGVWLHDSNCSSTSPLSALVKLNLVESNSWQTLSIVNSVGRFLLARPSLSCATIPSSPGSALVETFVTSYRNNPCSNRSSHSERMRRSNFDFSRSKGPAEPPELVSLPLELSASGTVWSPKLPKLRVRFGMLAMRCGERHIGISWPPLQMSATVRFALSEMTLSDLLLCIVPVIARRDSAIRTKLFARAQDATRLAPEDAPPLITVFFFLVPVSSAFFVRRRAPSALETSPSQVQRILGPAPAARRRSPTVPAHHGHHSSSLRLSKPPVLCVC
mmetsp:Transcript_29483/g.96011  ORF Transcript_29483/g.96011 Transcript_29483/m.96011 type:complete len:349 (-) Transcript_29483:106-1152(-)